MKSSTRGLDHSSPFRSSWSDSLPARYVRLRHRRRPPAPWRILILGWLLTTVLFFAFTIGVMAAIGIALYLYILQFMPTPDQLRGITVHQSSKIYDRRGNLLYEIFDDTGGRRTVVTADQIPLALKQATIATEDPTFYTNPGIDPQGIVRAVYYLWRTRRPTVGGSTITQQPGLIAGPRCPKNKQFQEIFLAEQAPQMYDNAWVTLPIDRNNGLLANDRCPPDIVEMQSFMKMPDDMRLSDTLAREWAIAHGIAQPPTESSPCAQ